MSWQDLINHLQLTTNKVDKVIVYNRQGRPLAITDNVETNQSEGQAVVNSLLDISTTMCKLCVDNETFLFVKGNDSTLVGKSTKVKERIAVVCRDNDEFILLIGEPSRNTSFTAEILKSLVLRSEGQLINLHKQQLPLDGLSDFSSPGPSVGSEHILVDVGQDTVT